MRNKTFLLTVMFLGVAASPAPAASFTQTGKGFVYAYPERGRLQPVEARVEIPPGGFDLRGLAVCAKFTRNFEEKGRESGRFLGEIRVYNSKKDFDSGKLALISVERSKKLRQNKARICVPLWELEAGQFVVAKLKLQKVSPQKVPPGREAWIKIWVEPAFSVQ